jgi:hypothetical protein
MWWYVVSSIVTFAIFLHFNFMALSRCATHLFGCGILDVVEFDATHHFCHVSVDKKRNAIKTRLYWTTCGFLPLPC